MSNELSLPQAWANVIAALEAVQANRQQWLLLEASIAKVSEMLFAVSDPYTTNEGARHG